MRMFRICCFVTVLSLTGCVPAGERYKPLTFGTAVKTSYYPSYLTTELQPVMKYDYYSGDMKVKWESVTVTVPDRWSVNLQATVQLEDGTTMVKTREVFVGEATYNEVIVGEFYRLERNERNREVLVAGNAEEVER